MDWLSRDGDADVLLAWALVVVLAASGVWHLLAGTYAWAALVGIVLVVVLVPPAVAKDPTMMVEPLPLLLAGLPVVVHSFGVLTQVTAYLAVAAIALIVAVEIDTFSSTELTPVIAVVFVVLTTMTVAALWGIARFVSDVYFGTSYLRDTAELMWDLVVAAGTGIGAGVLFEFYLQGVEPGDALQEEGLAPEES